MALKQVVVLLSVLVPCYGSSPIGVTLPKMPSPTDTWQNVTVAFLNTGVFNNIALHCTPFFGMKEDGTTEVNKASWGWERRADGYPPEITGTHAYCLVGTGCVNTETCKDDWSRQEDKPYIPSGTYTLSWAGTGSVDVKQPPAGSSVVSGSTVTLSANTPFAIVITSSAADDPVLHIALRKANAVGTFTQDFLSSFSGVGAINFCEWQASGIPVSRATELAAALSVESMFCMPLYAEAQVYESLVAEILKQAPTKTYLTTEPLKSHLAGKQSASKKAFSTARKAWSSNAPLVLVALLDSQWVAGAIDSFRSVMHEVDAIALGAGFGNAKGKPPAMLEAMGIDDDGGWKYPEAAQQDLPSMLAVVKDLQLSAEAGLWSEISYIKGTEHVKAKQIFAWNGMPLMRPRRYDFRGGERILQHCVKAATFPCRLGNTGVVVNGVEDMNDAFQEQLAANKTAEAKMHDMLAAAQLSNEVGDMLVDHIKRWAAMSNNALFMTGPMYEHPRNLVNGSSGDPDNGVIGNAALAVRPPWHTGMGTDNRWEAVKTYISHGGTPAMPVSSVPSPCDISCVDGTCYMGKCVCYSGRGGAACDQVVSDKKDCGSPEMDINPGGLADWSTAYVFWDAMKQGRDWVTQEFTSFTWDTKLPVATLPSGYPSRLGVNQKVGTMVIRDVNLHGRSGWYVITWEGDGIVDVSLTSVRKVRRVTPGRIEVLVVLTTDGNNGVFISILKTNPQNPVRNMRFVPVIAEQESLHFPFQPHIVSLYNEFSRIRFMNWGNTNSDFGVGMRDLQWSQRTQLTDRTYTSKTGIPYEVMIQMANVVGAHPWFCIPHSATDSFVRSLASLIHASLRSDLVATIEYSNEAWANPDASYYGGLHSGGIWAAIKGAPQGLSHYCYVVKRTKEYRDIIISSLGSSVASSRFRFILAPQAGYSETGRVMLGLNSAPWMTSCSGNPYEWVDAIAIAPYAGGDPASEYGPATSHQNDGAWVEEAILKGTAKSLEFAKNMSRDYKAIVDEANALRSSSSPIKYIMYEGGLHFGYPTEMNIPLNFHPAIKDVVTNYWKQQAQQGFDSMMQFIGFGAPGKNWGRGGDPFAMLNSPFTRPEDAPKFQGLVNYMRQRASGCVLQFQVFMSPDATNCFNGASCRTGRCDKPAEWVGTGVCTCAVGTYGTTCEKSEPAKVEFCGYKCGMTSDPAVYEQHTINNETRTSKASKGRCVQLQRNKRVFAKGVWHISKESKIVSTCKCHPPFFGAHCDLFDCPQNCNWRGKCKHPGVVASDASPLLPVSHQCNCYRGFTGSFCEVDCGCVGTDGQVHGSCTENNVCQPDQGWKGKTGVKGLEWDCGCDTCSAPNMCACPACDKGTCFNGVCLCWVGYTGEKCDASIDVAELEKLKSTWHSVNVGGVNYWSQSWPFVDIFQQSSEWTSVYRHNLYSATYEWGNGQSVNIDRDGLPFVLHGDQGLSSLVNRNTLKRSPVGDYTMRWHGDVQLKVGFDAVPLSEGKGKIVASFRNTCAGRGKPGEEEACNALREGTSVYVGDNGWLTHIDKLGPEQFRNIELILPGFEDRARDLPFHPMYLRDLASYRSIRFHPWIDQEVPGAQRTVEFPGRGPLQGGREVKWVDRIRVGEKFHLNGRFQRHQVPWEYMLTLCNIVHAAPWLNAPPSASVDWVESLAKLVLANLRGDQMAYLEYGNEMWNPLFIGAEWAADKGIEEGLDQDRAPAQYKYYARRSVVLCRKWKAVLGDRGKCILAGWITMDGVNRVILQAAKGVLTSEETLSGLFSSFAIAAYYNCGLGQRGDHDVQLSLDEMASACKADTSMNSFKASLAEAKVTAAEYGLDLSSYEAGPHIMESSAIHAGRATTGLTAKFIAFSRTSVMEDIYKMYMDAAKEYLTEWLQFTASGESSKYGSFGLKEWTGQYPDPPKLRAMYKDLPIAGNEKRCLDAGVAAFGLGLERNIFVGPPFILSPVHGYVAYEELRLRWNTNDVSSIRSVTVRKLGSCTDVLQLRIPGGPEVQGSSKVQGGSKVPVGDITLDLPLEGLDGKLYVAIVTYGATYYSEPFVNMARANKPAVPAVTTVTEDPAPPPQGSTVAGMLLEVSVDLKDIDVDGFSSKLLKKLNAVAARMGRGLVTRVVVKYLCVLPVEQLRHGISESDKLNPSRCTMVNRRQASLSAVAVEQCAACATVADVELEARQSLSSITNTVSEVAQDSESDLARMILAVEIEKQEDDDNDSIAPLDSAHVTGPSCMLLVAAVLSVLVL